MPRIRQSTFAGGEISPEFHSATHLERYPTCLARCENFIVRPFGGAVNRNGSVHAAYAGSSISAPLIPFVVSGTVGYLIELSHLSMRIWTNDLVPVLIQTLVSPYTVDEVDHVRFVQSVDVMTLFHPMHIMHNLTRLLATTNLVTTNFSLEAWEVVRPIGPPVVKGFRVVHTVSPPTSRVWSYIVTAVTTKGEESLGSIIMRKALPVDPTYGTMIVLVFDPVPGADYYNVYKGADDFFGFIGQIKQTPDNFKDWAQEVGNPAWVHGGGDPVIQLWYDPYLAYGDPGSQHTGADPLIGIGFIDWNTGPDYGEGPPVEKIVFEDPGDYPALGEYYQQRLLVAGMLNEPQRVQGSMTGQFRRFDATISAKESDALDFTIDSVRYDKIVGLMKLTSLILFTQDAEYTVGGVSPEFSPSSPLSPSSISVLARSYFGSADIAPLRVGDSGLFVGRASGIRDVTWDANTSGIVSSDLAIMAPHLLKDRTVVSWAYQHEPNRCVWIVLDNGEMIAITYVREHQTWGWHRHLTDGLYKWVTVVPGTKSDSLIVSVERNGTRRIERFTDGVYLDAAMTWDAPEVTVTLDEHESGGWLAGALVEMNMPQVLAAPIRAGDVFVIDGIDTVRVAWIGTGVHGFLPIGEALVDIPVQMQSTQLDAVVKKTSFSGADHLNGLSVCVVADGAVLDDQMVAGGTITIDRAAAHVVAGLHYRSLLETLDAASTAEDKAKQKTVNSVEVEVYSSRGLWVGQNESLLREGKGRVQADQYGTLQPKTLPLLVSIPGTWTKSGRIVVVQIDPVPATVLAVTREVTLA